MPKLDPFGFFRNNQRIFLAVFGILILVVFTVGPSLQSYQGTQAGGGTNANVAQWKPKKPWWHINRLWSATETITENE